MSDSPDPTTIAGNETLVVSFMVLQAEGWFKPGSGVYRLICHGGLGGGGQITLQRHKMSPALDLVWVDEWMEPMVTYVVVHALLKVLPDRCDVTNHRRGVFEVDLGELVLTTDIRH